MSQMHLKQGNCISAADHDVNWSQSIVVAYKLLNNDVNKKQLTPKRVRAYQLLQHNVNNKEFNPKQTSSISAAETMM